MDSMDGAFQWVPTELRLRRLDDFDDELLQLVIGNGNQQGNITQPTTDAMANTTAGEVHYEADKVALVVPRITGMISLLAIACVAIEAWKDLSSDRRNSVGGSGRFRIITYIQLFYQFPLFCVALAFALGTTPAPQDFGIWGGVGSTATCTAQGFIFQFGVTAAIGWDAALSLTYLLMVRCNLTDFRLLHYLKYYHLVIWLFSSAMSFYPLVKDMFSFNHSLCWLQSYPDNCVGDECIRGEGATEWQNLVSFLMTLHLIYSIAAMLTLYCSMRRLENQIQRDTSTRAENPREDASTVVSRRNSRRVGIQGMLYASGMIITTLPMTVYVLLGNMVGVWDAGFFVFANSVIPLIGYINFLIFMRRRTKCHTGYAKLLRKLHSWLFDYECICHFQCHCNIQCLQFRRGKGENTAPTTSPQRDTRTDCCETAQAKPGDSPNDTECGDHSFSEADASSRGKAFMITVKRISNGDSQLVSDLGESQDTSECDRFDVSPKIPLRMKSSAEGPPTMPTRITSEFADVDPSISNRRPKALQAPPSKPVRLETFVSETSVPDHYQLEGDKSSKPQGEGAPPCKPTRLESCVLETVKEDVGVGEDKHLKLRKGGAPPSKPERLESCIPEEADR